MMTGTTVAAAALCSLAAVASVPVGAQAPAMAAAAPTFNNEIAPMSLLTFKDARP